MRLTPQEIKNNGLKYEPWEAGMFCWRWSRDNRAERFFFSSNCVVQWEEQSKERETSEITIETDYEAFVDALLSDPATSFWLKEAIRALGVRDPVDALGDAGVLFTLQQRRNI